MVKNEKRFFAVVIFLCLIFFNLPSGTLVAKAQYKGELLSTFTTDLKGSSENRIYNVKLAVSKLDGFVLDSGAVFSFNDVTLSRTKENGYRESPIIEYGKFTMGYGGGVCQVSTTLYNAVILAGLKIISVSSHSLPVSYVAPSMDAMVSSATDFRFFNDTPYPITISSKVTNNRVSVCIFGFKTITDGEEIKFKSTVTERLYATYDETLDLLGSLKDNEERKVIKLAKDGLISTCHKEVYYQGKLVSSTLFRKDRYNPQNGIMLVRENVHTSTG